MNGPIAQLGARLNGIEKVASSNLAGSTVNRDQAWSRLCYNGENLNKPVMTGVVGHPVSEKGERGGSPSAVSAGIPAGPNSPVVRQDRLRW